MLERLRPVASSTETSPFHDGEYSVQRRAGVVDEAAQFAGMLRRDSFTSMMARFVGEQRMVFVTARDLSGALWTSSISGERGFCAATGSVLRVRRTAPAGDPLARMTVGQRIGLLMIDFAKQRRLRVNGVLADADDRALEVVVEQVYGNCPKYIDQRVVERSGMCSYAPAAASLSVTGRRLVARTNRFILGTTHPTCGPDTSHRGGTAGFVRVHGNELWWPDYVGNNLFNSLGNIVVDPAASMLVDDVSGQVQLSGVAHVEWGSTTLLPGESDTGRWVRFEVTSVVEGT